MINRLFRANLYTMAMGIKLLSLLAVGWIKRDEADLLGIYALCLGLTNSFYIFSGLRARFLVLRSIETDRQFANLNLLLASLGILATAIVYYLNHSDPLFVLIIAVAITKLFETFLDAGTSLLQKRKGREVAFRILNQFAVLNAVSFATLLLVDIKLAVVAEGLLLFVTILRQQRACRRPDAEQEPFTITGLAKVGWIGALFTASATLNAAQMTYFLYSFRDASSGAELLLIAKIFFVQAIISRVVTANNFYFKDGIQRFFARISFVAKIIATASLAIVPLAYFNFTENVAYQVIAIGAAFTLINSIGTITRQHLLIVQGPEKLIFLHLAELVVLIFVIGLLNAPVVASLAVLTGLRYLRTIWLMNGHDQSGSGEKA